MTPFEAYGDESSRKTFDGELNYQCGKIFFLLFIGLFVWLLYIPADLRIHPFAEEYGFVIIAIRGGLTLLSACAIGLRFTQKFRYRPKFFIKIVRRASLPRLYKTMSMKIRMREYQTNFSRKALMTASDLELTCSFL